MMNARQKGKRGIAGGQSRRQMYIGRSNDNPMSLLLNGKLESKGHSEGKINEISRETKTDE
jgi:hypothetical protein